MKSGFRTAQPARHLPAARPTVGLLQPQSPHPEHGHPRTPITLGRRCCHLQAAGQVGTPLCGVG